MYTQLWTKLRKEWKAYRIAKVQNSTANMKTHAIKIRELQEQLGVSKASFPDLGLVD